MQASDSHLDTLHILPLRYIPLETGGLRRARLIKTVRLESMVELYDEEGVGTGRVKPGELRNVFDFSGDRARDPKIVAELAGLHSYDVFSLRISLRQLDLELDGVDGFRLSDDKAAELSQYMAEFTRPLVRFVCGEVSDSAGNLSDLLRLLTGSNSNTALRNLRRLATLLGIDVIRIPEFLQDYADVYTSLSFYRQCLEQIRPQYADFAGSLKAIKATREARSDPQLVKDCDMIAARFNMLFKSTTDTLDKFRERTEYMWENPTAESYRQMERLVHDHQSRISETLCALTAKMDAWDREFSAGKDGRIADKAAFARSEIKYGLDKIQPLNFAGS